MELIITKWEPYSTMHSETGGVVFDRLNKAQDALFFSKRPIIPFKNILLPNHISLNAFSRNRKLAFIGLSNCDIWALHRFLKEFRHTDLLPERKNVLIFGSECYPDKDCFCHKFGADQYADFDLFVQEEKDGFSIFSGSKEGENILKKLELKPSNKLKLRSIFDKTQTRFDEDLLHNLIQNRDANEEFWQGIADKCFGCGACTAVCPLCFCTRLESENKIDGTEQTCLNWDSCFAKRFSEIQNRCDLRPKNVDRLYNWYHHKFVRAKKQNDHFLCTGCGRCIEACPANLNIKNILESLLEKNEK